MTMQQYDVDFHVKGIYRFRVTSPTSEAVKVWAENRANLIAEDLDETGMHEVLDIGAPVIGVLTPPFEFQGSAMGTVLNAEGSEYTPPAPVDTEPLVGVVTSTFAKLEARIASLEKAVGDLSRLVRGPQS